MTGDLFPMPKLDAYASQSHYAEHLAPIWRALPRNLRGAFMTTDEIVDDVRRLGIEPRAARATAPGRLVLVASWPDLNWCAPSRCVFVEHGMGQTYDYPHKSYAGGTNRGNVAAYVVANEHTASACRAMQPDVPVSVVGSPRLDRWHREQKWPRQPKSKPVVAVSFHFPAGDVAPEAHWALPHYLEGLEQLAADDRFEIIGHGHPKAWDELSKVWDVLDVAKVPRFDDVLDRAHLYVCDNSSTLYEFASTNRPVVCLNAPWYRRNVEHGLRFWSHVPGVQCDSSAELLFAVEDALCDSQEARAARTRAVDFALHLRDGAATERAAAAVRRAVSEETLRSD